MRKIERLASMAQARSVPRPLDGGGVMARLRGLEIENDNVLSLPLRFFAGGAAAAAVAAAGVSLLAATAWTEMADPFTAMDHLVNVMDVL